MKYLIILALLVGCGKIPDTTEEFRSSPKAAPTTPSEPSPEPIITNTPSPTPSTPPIVVEPITCQLQAGQAICDGHTIDLYWNFSVPRARSIVVTSAINNCVTIQIHNFGVLLGTQSFCGTEVVEELDAPIGQNGWVLR